MAMTLRALALSVACLSLAPFAVTQPAPDTPVARQAPATAAPATGAARPSSAGTTSARTGATPARPPSVTGATPARPASATGAPPARAQAANPAPPTAEAVRQPIAMLEREVFGACTQDDLAITRVSGGPVEPRMRVERQMREAGIRTQRYVYRATGCGRAPRRHNIEIVAREGQPTRAIALPMGDTAVTSIIMQGAFTQIFTPMMRDQYPGCAPAQLKVLGTTIARGTPFTAGQAWTESWRFDACGARGVAELTFAYDGDGVRMTASVPAAAGSASQGATPSASPGATPAPRATPGATPAARRTTSGATPTAPRTP